MFLHLIEHTVVTGKKHNENLLGDNVAIINGIDLKTLIARADNVKENHNGVSAKIKFLNNKLSHKYAFFPSQIFA